MLRFMWQKLIHKKWMVISLLIGNILLIAIAVSHPMYQKASLQRMLEDEFNLYMEEHNEYPAQLYMNSTIQKKDSQGFYQMKELVARVNKELGLTLSLGVEVYNVQESKATTLTKRSDNEGELSLQVTTIKHLEDHVTILSGRMYEKEITKDGFIEVIMSESTMVNMDLLLGEEIEFIYLTDSQEQPIKLRIVGIFENSDTSDSYWFKSPDSYRRNCMISYEIFERIFLDPSSNKYVIKGNWNLQFDYSKISVDQVDGIINASKEILETKLSNGTISSPNYLSVLMEFQNSKNRVQVTLMILEVPVLVLLCAFLYMISGQLLELEQNEISQLKSRGAGKIQIFGLYFIQSMILSCVSFVLGLPLGSYLCRVLGSSNAFLEFVSRRPLRVTITREVLVYAAIAVLLSILMTVLPVIRYSKISIVNLKQKRSHSHKRLWQKLCLDVMAILISSYGYYLFQGQKKELAERVFAGKALDPLLFLCSSLFILGVGLFSLRFQPLLVKLIFLLGKKRWKPASYSSFLQIIRTGSKQHFIMTFLILTVALGIFNSTVARTILTNAEDNIRYNIGADLVVRELWDSNILMVQYDKSIPLVYKEPDFGKYEELSEISSVAKVFRDDTIIFRNQRDTYNATVLGINTKTYGETAKLPDDLLFYDYYDYLNAIAGNTDAILVSMNFKDKLSYQLGDTINYSNSKGERISGTIYGFVDYWPSYLPSNTILEADGSTSTTSNYLIVAHLSRIQEVFGITPYDVYIDVKDKTDFFYDFANDRKLQFLKFIDLSEEVREVRNETLFQGTNGILTMSFIVILILCCAGFMIYWILSIRSRELLFGVFRAMGMGHKEILHMLINEQIFSGLYSILAGLLVGLLASVLFVPLIQIAYSATNQVLPLRLLTQQTDLIRLLLVIGVVFVGCIAILAHLIFKMKISQALKLGED